MSSEKAELKTLISADQIRDRVCAMAEAIETDYQGRQPVLVGILKGSFVFLADLARALKLEHSIDFIMVSSYDTSPRTSGVVKLLMDLSRDISGEDVIIVEDIVDSGRTLDYIYRNLLMRRPRSLAIASLLAKKGRREVDLDIRYVGFEIADHFVVGYGLDEAEAFRGLPYIAYLPEKGSN